MKIVHSIVFMFLLITQIKTTIISPTSQQKNIQKTQNAQKNPKDKRKLFDLAGGFADAFEDAGKEMQSGFDEAADNATSLGKDYDTMKNTFEQGAKDIEAGAATAGSDITGGFNEGLSSIGQGFQDATDPNWDFQEPEHPESKHHEPEHHKTEEGESWYPGKHIGEWMSGDGHGKQGDGESGWYPGKHLGDWMGGHFGDGGLFDFGDLADISLQKDSHILHDHNYHKGGKAYHHISGDHYGIHFDEDTEEEHLHNFKKISGDLAAYEEEYIACIDDISDFNFREDEIEGCVGPNFIKLLLDVKYETYKIISKADAKVREYFVHYCYIPAGEDIGFSKACDLMEKDLLDLLWGCLDFLEILSINQEKYLNEYTKIELERFQEITNGLVGFSKEYFDLLDEIDAHKEVTLLRIKNHIDDRTKLIITNAKLDPENAPQPKIVKHYIQLEEKVSDPNFVVTEKLPHYPVEGKPEEPLSTDFAALEENEEEQEEPLHSEEILEEGHEHHENQDHNEYDGEELEHFEEDPIERRTSDRRRRLSFSEKDNRYRFLNSGGKYSGLNSLHGSRRLNMRRNADSMKAKYRKWLGSLGKMKGGKGNYQNIHTHFSKQKAKQ